MLNNPFLQQELTMPSLGDVLSGLSYAADTPGALLRGGIGNLIDLFTGDDKQHGWRASSRDLLEQRGGFAPNEDGIDTGDVLGFAGDVILDPLNLVGGGLLAKMIGKGTRAKAANVARSRINLAADRGILTDTPVE